MQRFTEQELTDAVMVLASEHSDDPEVKALFDKLVNDLATCHRQNACDHYAMYVGGRGKCRVCGYRRG